MNGGIKSNVVGGSFGLQALSLTSIKASQQSVHLTLGILRTSQAVSYALSIFWLDGFAVPAPAQVTQTVSPLAQWEFQECVMSSHLSF
ncbi:MAG: hypothetical protein U0X74_00445 [Anaerolineales bacterium]